MNSQAVPRLAIIGCGTVVRNHLLPALGRIGWDPSVLIDVSPARLEMVARKLGGKGRTLLKALNWQSVATQFDAAIVAVPPALHGPIGISLVEAGKHVFMEKPLATKGQECQAMIGAASRKCVALRVGLLRRYLHIARWTKALVESGVLGEIQRFDAREGFVVNSATSFPGTLDTRLAGGGVLTDTGAHTLDLLLCWLGEVESFTYNDDSVGGVEADCILDCRLASGATGRVELSRTRNLRNTIRIEGTQGFIEVHLYKNEVVAGSSNALAFRHDGFDGSEMQPQFLEELFDSELRDYRKAASGAEPVGISGREGSKSVELIERCYAARQPLRFPWSEVSISPAAESGWSAIMPPGSKVLVTGGAGFIGGRLIEQLVQMDGVQVRCLVRSFASATQVARLPVEIAQADLTNRGDVGRAVEGMNYVFHCAYDPRSLRQNIDGIHNLIEACTSNSVRRLVHVSTFSVYEPFPEGILTEETRDGHRSWTYVNTKLDLEKMVLDAVRDRGAQATIVQPTIVYGPFGKSWTNEVAEMLIFGDVILPDDSGGLCNAVYIDDLTDGLILAALSPAAIGQRFVMSGPDIVAWATFFREFARALGTDDPKFWPCEQISKANHSVLRDIRLVTSDPKKIIQIVARWQLARRFLQVGLDRLPHTLRTRVMKHHYGSGKPHVGQTFLPDLQKLALYTAKARTDCSKARRLLGYNPRFNFYDGMALTRQYLQWAYGDTVQKIASERGRSTMIENASLVSSANVD